MDSLYHYLATMTVAVGHGEIGGSSLRLDHDLDELVSRLDEAGVRVARIRESTGYGRLCRTFRTGHGDTIVTAIVGRVTEVELLTRLMLPDPPR